MSEVRCLVCKSIINFHEYEKVDQKFYDGAIFKIHPWYGSKFDCDILESGICDSCIRNCMDDGSIRKIGSHL